MHRHSGRQKGPTTAMSATSRGERTSSVRSEERTDTRIWSLRTNSPRLFRHARQDSRSAVLGIRLRIGGGRTGATNAPEATVSALAAEMLIANIQ